MRNEYLLMDKIEGPLVVLSGIKDAAYDEVVEIILEDGQVQKGKVVQIHEDKIILQVFGSTTGFSLSGISVRFTGKPLRIALSKDMLGRVFNGVGKAIDHAGEFFGSTEWDINSMPINPVSRRYPRNYIQTGISTIDGLITLIRGQKLPIFSGNGLPHNELTAQIVKQAKVMSDTDDKFAVVFAAMGIKHDDADFFKSSFEKSGVLENVVMFVNLADDPIIERITTPRCALTAAEYLAFEHDMHILVILTDMTNYCEALRELSSAREEVPSRKGYPGYMYSDLASLYERAGMIRGKKGSITQIPIISMPNDDITHPIPDLTGYITEGQIVLSRDLYQNNINPPINILPSLSRLMKDGIGKDFTREDHPELADQIFSAYSRVQEVVALSQVIGEEELSEADKKYMEFGKQFELRFANQDPTDNRNIKTTLDLGWELLNLLPPEDLKRINPEIIKKYI